MLGEFFDKNKSCAPGGGYGACVTLCHVTGGMKKDKRLSNNQS